MTGRASPAPLLSQALPTAAGKCASCVGLQTSRVGDSVSLTAIGMGSKYKQQAVASTNLQSVSGAEGGGGGSGTEGCASRGSGGSKAGRPHVLSQLTACAQVILLCQFVLQYICSATLLSCLQIKVKTTSLTTCNTGES